MRKLWILAMVPLLFIISCGSKDSSKNNKEAEAKMEKVHKAKDYQQMLTLADELETAGELSTATADYWRGYASDRMKRKRMAEFYWKASLEDADENMVIYAKSASRLVNLLTVRGDYESALKDAIPVAGRLEEEQCDTTSDYINLLIYIGCCQAGLGKAGNATADGFDRAYQKHLDNIEKHHSDAAYKDAIAGLINIAYACITIEDYNKALIWTDNFGKLLGEYEQRPGTNNDYVDKQLARFYIYKAIALEGLGQKDEASKVYEAFMTTEFSKTPEGRINANDYLMAANRWGEAADNYKSLDALLAKQEYGYSIVNIQNMMLKKYRTNLAAGRRDSAIAVSLQICDSLDNAFAEAKKIDEEEQATIIQKVEQMTEQHVEATRKNYLTLLSAFIGVLLCFIGYVLYRRHSYRKLQQTHKELKDAYGQLKDITMAKGRQDTEQRIARTIQQNMVPKALPQYKGLGLHATLIPGNGINSDLYECIIRDDKLFFCIGNAIEDNIQSSVLAGTVWALFRTAATLEDAPEQIITAINEAIVKESQTEVGISLFVGVLDLKTWQLTYCNAGHDTPILLMGEEIGQLDAEPNKAIGTTRGYTYVSQAKAIDTGTMLFLYSDGLLKAKNAEGKSYGEKRMRGAALQSMKMHPTAKPFMESMDEAIKKHTGDIQQDSDITMMVIQR